MAKFMGPQYMTANMQVFAEILNSSGTNLSINVY